MMVGQPGKVSLAENGLQHENRVGNIDGYDIKNRKTCRFLDGNVIAYDDDHSDRAAQVGKDNPLLEAASDASTTFRNVGDCP